MVRGVVGGDVRIGTPPTDDNRSYHISSDRIKRALGFEARRTITDATRDLVRAMREGQVPDAMSDERYYNIKLMQRVKLQRDGEGLEELDRIAREIRGRVVEM